MMIISVEQEWKNKQNNKRITEFFNTLLFETPSGQRFTTDSPVLGNVWLSYARNPLEPVDLILSIQRDRSTGQAAKQIREMINRLRHGHRDDNGTLIRAAAPDLGPLKQNQKLSPRITYIPGQIAARFYFDELMRIALPLCPWWQQTIDSMNRLNTHNGNAAQVWSPDWCQFPIDEDGKMSALMTEGLMLMRQGIGGAVIDKSDNHKERYVRELPVDLLWMIRMAGVISYIIHTHDHSQEVSNLMTSYQLDFENEDDALTLIEKDFLYRSFDAKGNTVLPQSVHARKLNSQQQAVVDPIVRVEHAKLARHCIASHFFKLFENWKCKSTCQPDYFIWRVTRNRTAELAVNESSKTIKADAARRLFDTSCNEITWAIIDSGIDKDHHAFKDAQGSDTNVNIDELPTRVIKTLDFTHLRDLLDFEVLSYAGGQSFDNDSNTSHQVKSDTDEVVARHVYQELFESLVSKRLHKNKAGEGVKNEAQIRTEVADELKRLANRIHKGNDIDWETLEPLIVDHNPGVPANDHGTHVGGILASDWVEEYEQADKPLNQRPRRMVGVCPDIKLIDCRVLREQGDTDEFEILAAIQFLRWMNSRAGHTVVHGANISMSLIHEVRRYACGQTPVCIECNEAVSLGMVIVAAAGNRGHDVVEDFVITGRTKNYRAMSVTDPGNAEHVITVGSTHRKRPHDYGVSFFSSRGPTGDGRVKPDIVAPGERIEGPIPRGGIERKDGTSMAAPHVSGAAAMLMARHKELVGNPKKIKKVLCETATDLERQNYFQGHGLVDVLRALQSV